jgi:hypothetical protein
MRIIVIFTLLLAGCVHRTPVRAPINRLATSGFSYIQESDGSYTVLVYNKAGLEAAKVYLKCKPCIEQKVGEVYVLEGAK